MARIGIRALPVSASLFESGPANFSDFNNVAVLHYEQAPNTNPPEDPSVNIPVSKLPLVETNLHVSRKVSPSDLLIDEVNFFTVQPLTCSPVVRFHFNNSFALTSSLSFSLENLYLAALILTLT